MEGASCALATQERLNVLLFSSLCPPCLACIIFWAVYELCTLKLTHTHAHSGGVHGTPYTFMYSSIAVALWTPYWKAQSTNTTSARALEDTGQCCKRSICRALMVLYTRRELYRGSTEPLLSAQRNHTRRNHSTY